MSNFTKIKKIGAYSSRADYGLLTALFNLLTIAMILSYC